MSYSSVTPRSICGITFPRAFHVLWYPMHRGRVPGGCVEEGMKELVREGSRAPEVPLPMLWTHGCFVAAVGGVLPGAHRA
ncbi:hypothetical protein [Nocardiopsis sp. NPDC006832]|uniref:hypothetical protein n=1 Tax=Nocardiopsis sp. NPDC006832 TaxID=3157188 RepID=UPI0033EE602E